MKPKKHKQRRKQEPILSRGSMYLSVPDEHIGEKMVFPLRISQKRRDGVIEDSDSMKRYWLTLDSHNDADRKIKEIILIYEETQTTV